jgi:hypothetical protein
MQSTSVNVAFLPIWALVPGNEADVDRVSGVLIDFARARLGLE